MLEALEFPNDDVQVDLARKVIHGDGLVEQVDFTGGQAQLKDGVLELNEVGRGLACEEFGDSGNPTGLKDLTQLVKDKAELGEGRFLGGQFKVFLGSRQVQHIIF